jgi:hypothetical protein
MDVGLASAGGKKFHDHYNQQDFEAIYNESDPKLRAAVTQEKFVALLTHVHEKLGNVTDATRSGVNVNYNFGGSTITMTYSAKFQLADGTEQFIWLKSGGAVRLLRFDIQSPALNDSNLQ